MGGYEILSTDEIMKSMESKAKAKHEGHTGKYAKDSTGEDEAEGHEGKYAKGNKKKKKVEKSMNHPRNGDKASGTGTVGDKSVGNNSKKSPGRTKKDKKDEDEHTGTPGLDHEEHNPANDTSDLKAGKKKISKGLGILSEIAKQIGPDHINKLCYANKCTVEELAMKLDPTAPEPTVQEQIGAGEGTPASEIEHVIDTNPKQGLGTNPQQKI